MMKEKRNPTSGKDKGLITLSAVGFDSPGLVSKITKRILELGGNIVDVEENCRRDLFSIFLIIDFSSSACTSEDIEHRLNLLEAETGLKVMTAEYVQDETCCLPAKESHLVTILGPDRPGIMADVSTFFHEHNINIEQSKMIARGNFFSMEMLIDSCRMPGMPGAHRKQVIDDMAENLKKLCLEMDLSVVIQSEDIYRKLKKLVVFDVESSLVQSPSLGRSLDGVKKKMGRLSDGTTFPEERDDLQALRQTAKSMKGIPMQEFESFGHALQLNPGSLELIRILKSMGFKIALLSSGFNFFIKDMLEKAGVDYAFSNSLEVDENGLVTGRLGEPVITGDTKEDLLEFIMNIEGIGRDQVIAVGDGSTRSHFIKNAGLSIAFKPQDTDIKADGVLSSGQITNILYCMGIPKTELDKYLEP